MKKNFLKAGIALTMVSALVLGSCGKYEEGPGLSLRTKTARITGVWDAKEYVSSNGTVTADNSTSTVEMVKDGAFKVTSGSTTTTGTWEFSSDKSKVKTTFSYTLLGQTITNTSESTIIRLTNEELWLKDEDGDISKSVKI